MENFKSFSNDVAMKGIVEYLKKFQHFDNIPSNLFKETVKITSELKITHLLRKNT